MAVGGVQVLVMGEENEREITIEEVKRALNETKGGKAPGMDGVRVEMLKEGGVTVLEWLVRLFNICFMFSIVPVDWVITCMVPLYKDKGDMYECSNLRGIRNEDGARLNVMLNGEALEEVDQFKYLGSVIAANGGVEADVHHRVNEGCKVLGALK